MDGIRYISPECRLHDHVECPKVRVSLKCECLCHKIVGEWQTLIVKNVTVI